jgi:hypothetical protein
MTEQERADWLARAVDELVHKTGEGPDAGITDKKLLSLLRVAESRADASRRRRASAAETDHQSRVWHNVLSRLTRFGTDLPEPELEPDDAAEMAKLIAARRKASEEMMALAEQFRDDVWAQVKERIAHSEDSIERASAWWPRAGPRSAIGTAAPGALAYSSGDPHFDSLVRVALAHGGAAARGGVRIGNRGRASSERPGNPDLRTAGSRLLSGSVALAAAAVLAVAAIGPLPVTGFASHPVVVAVEHTAEAFGVTRSDAAPPTPGEGRVVAGVEVTLSEARLLTGLPVTQPGVLPDGFTLALSQYYSASIAAREGGLYAMTYENHAGASINIYQETGSETDLAVPGRTTVTELNDGRTATYFDGRWHDSGDGVLSWEDSRSQTLIFAGRGVRVMIQYSGPHIEPMILVDVANSMLAQQ